MKPIDIWKGKKDGPEKEQNDGYSKETFAFCPA